MRVKDLLEILENADPEADVFAVICLGNDDELHIGIKDVEDFLNFNRRDELKMKKTKIICTMGPNTNDRALMKRLVENGMDIARFNFSHGDHAEQKERMDMLKSIREEVGRPIAILLDTKGPEIRTGLLKNGEKVFLEEGQTFILTTTTIEGDKDKVSITYDGLAEDVEIGKTILIDDGLIELKVKNIIDTEIVCTVINGGELGQQKGINVPNVKVKLPAITEQDKKDIAFGVQNDVDYIACSFTKSETEPSGIYGSKCCKHCNSSHIHSCPYVFFPALGSP